MIDDNDIDRLFSAYGADARRWPEEVREDALERIANSGRTFESFAGEALKLDAILNNLQVPQTSGRLQTDILALPDKPASTVLTLSGSGRALKTLQVRYWRAAAGLAAAAVLGFVAGAQIPAEEDPLDALDISAFVQGVTADEEQFL